MIELKAESSQDISKKKNQDKELILLNSRNSNGSL